MKVLLVNGSPHKNGNTFRALSKVEDVFKKNNIEVEWLHHGYKINDRDNRKRGIKI